VTKGRTSADIENLIKQGVNWFGENRVQEIQEKWPELKASYPHVKLQFIGRLQSNKAGVAVHLCDSIISLDRPSLVDAVAQSLAKNPKHMEFLVQVSLAGETQKGGVSPEKLGELLDYCQSKELTINGLMTIPPLEGDPKPIFKKLHQLCAQYHLKEISMGMSDDYEDALREGATQVRIGRALFETL
jgi:pyridoxal phosphate enzyme (YggS family)